MRKPHRAAVSLSVSQNFLMSRATVRRIVKLARLEPGDHVIEIGAGKGHITRELAFHCGRLTAVELDGGLCVKLNQDFSGIENVRVLHRDFLQMKLPAAPDYKIFANIPFSVTTPIIEKITGCENPPAAAWLVMEKGAAIRFMRSPALKPFFKLRIVHYFQREDFHPSPSVDTVLLHFYRREQPDLPIAMRGAFKNFIKECQSKGWRRFLSAKQTSAALRQEGLPPLKASGEILYVQWLCLFRFVFRECNQ